MDLIFSPQTYLADSFSLSIFQKGFFRIFFAFLIVSA